jgi:hypothetical protein
MFALIHAEPVGMYTPAHAAAETRICSRMPQRAAAQTARIWTTLRNASTLVP